MKLIVKYMNKSSDLVKKTTEENCKELLNWWLHEDTPTKEIDDIPIKLIRSQIKDVDYKEERIVDWDKINGKLN